MRFVRREGIGFDDSAEQNPPSECQGKLIKLVSVDWGDSYHIPGENAR